MRSLRKLIFPLLLAGGVIILAGCSSGPSADDMAHLDALKQEVASLQKEVTAKQAEKSSLEQQLATKKQQLSQAIQDENDTKSNLKNYK